MNYILSVENIVKRYANHTALNGVSLSVPTGSIYGLLGPNGAGKTSLIRIITQITAADEGNVFFNGEKLSPKHILQIGYLPEERGLYKKMSVGEQLIYLAQLKGLSSKEAKNRLKYWIERFEMQSWWKKNVGDLSKGMQQKVQFIAAIIHEPTLLILDEPFTGFDPINASLVTEAILDLRKKGITIIFSTHRMETVEELCDYVAMIHRSKKVLDGKKSAIKKQYSTHTFLLETTSPIQLPQGFRLLKQEQLEENHYEISVEILQGTTNDLLQAILPQTTILALKEKIPSMHDIFIEVVEKNQS
ncbi:MAG: ATP-binding cassette domain-containing protein [Flammeovirgaceae bacterium]|nr:ATP-binding cassette domain-containing protein [Flammeovirgaceae bacterium]MDW8288097.1 ATP-binding cassette domain-containing protein [Flammeovirgaceae bacterium]